MVKAASPSMVAHLNLSLVDCSPTPVGRMLMSIEYFKLIVSYSRKEMTKSTSGKKNIGPN